MNKQEIFDIALTSMIAQGKPAVSGDIPAYHVMTPEGVLHCAIGHVLAKKYSHRNTPEISGAEYILSEGLEGEERNAMYDFVYSVQSAHDQAWRWFDGKYVHRRQNAEFMKEFVKSMRKIAQKWNLTFPEIA